MGWLCLRLRYDVRSTEVPTFGPLGPWSPHTILTLVAPQTFACVVLCCCCCCCYFRCCRFLACSFCCCCICSRIIAIAPNSVEKIKFCPSTSTFTKHLQVRVTVATFIIYQSSIYAPISIVDTVWLLRTFHCIQRAVLPFYSIVCPILCEAVEGICWSCRRLRYDVRSTQVPTCWPLCPGTPHTILTLVAPQPWGCRQEKIAQSTIKLEVKMAQARLIFTLLYESWNNNHNN